MSLLKKLLGLLKKEEKVEERAEILEEKPEKIVLSSIPDVPGYQAQTEVVVEDEGIDIDEDEKKNTDEEEN